MNLKNWLAFAACVAVFTVTASADEMSFSPDKRWMMSVSQSPLDDSEIVFAVTNEIVSGPRPKIRRSIGFRCAAKQLSVLLDTQQTLTNDAELILRIGSDRAYSGTPPWKRMDGEPEAFVLLDSVQAGAFLNALIKTPSLFVRINDYRSADIRFDLTGVSQATENVRSACGSPDQ